MKVSVTFGGESYATSSQIRLLRVRFRTRAEGLHALALHRGKPFGYEDCDALRHEMKRVAADFFLLEGKNLPAGAVDGLLRWVERCELDDTGKLRVR